VNVFGASVARYSIVALIVVGFPAACRAQAGQGAAQMGAMDSTDHPAVMAAHDAMGQAHWAMLGAAAQAKDVLTAAQRAQVQAWVDSMHGRMRAQHSDMMERHN